MTDERAEARRPGSGEEVETQEARTPTDPQCEGLADAGTVTRGDRAAHLGSLYPHCEIVERTPVCVTYWDRTDPADPIRRYTDPREGDYPLLTRQVGAQVVRANSEAMGA